MNQHEIVKNIYKKVITKCPVGTFRNMTEKTANNYSLSTYYGVSFDERKGTNLMVCSPNATTAFSTNTGIHTRFLNFNTEQERYNAWQSYLTKFARFCIAMDESTKLAPYMEDYREPWTDERFKQYFELSDIEWQLIDTVIKD